MNERAARVKSGKLWTLGLLIFVRLFSYSVSVVAADNGAAIRWPDVAPGYQIHLPQDHAPHPRYRIEWWYFTGNLTASTGERFGYQLTFFRVGLNPAPDNHSAWTLTNLYASHFAISSLDRDSTYWSDEQLSRAALGMAGGDESRVWLLNNEVKFKDSGFSLRAAEKDQALQLELTSLKPVVLHGEAGYSRKGETPGNASYYYSFSRLKTEGELRWHGEKFKVSGESWMDHEWGSSFLEQGSRGWDWFSLQLSDGAELMLFQIRDESGRPIRFSSGTLVEATGAVRKLSAEQISLTPLRVWSSARSGASYPVEWQVVVPGYDLRVVANLDSQEFLSSDVGLGVNYWEGSVRVGDTRMSKTDEFGVGYLEMTGYPAGGSVAQALGSTAGDSSFRPRRQGTVPSVPDNGGQKELSPVMFAFAARRERSAHRRSSDHDTCRGRHTDSHSAFATRKTRLGQSSSAHKAKSDLGHDWQTQA